MSVPSSNKNDMSSDENEYFYKKHLIKDLCKKASAGPKKRMIVVESSKSWFDNKGTPENLSDDTPFAWTGSYSPAPAVINWTGEITGPGANWVQIDGWYYYVHIFEKQTGPSPTLTPSVMSSVSFSSAISNSDPGFPDSFADKRYSLVVQMETLDVDSVLAESEWSVKFTQSGNDLSWSAAP